MKKIVFLLFSLVLSISIYAQDESFEVDGISYKKLTSNTVEVEQVPFYNYGEEVSVTIPNEITYKKKKYSVTSIGESACCGNNGLVSITLPNSITSIGESAFESCLKLEKITMGDNISSIGKSAFCSCENLKSIAIPKSLKTIEEYTFEDCKSLSSVVIADNVTSIKASAFRGCTNMSSLSLSKNLESIGDYAFFACNKLETLEIPNGVKKIGHQSFSCLYHLKTLTIPSSLTTMEGDPFYLDYALTSIKVDKGNKCYDSRDNCNALIQKDGDVLLLGCVNTVIPKSVKKIGQCSFYACPITKTAIPEGVEDIDVGAFGYCADLVSVIIPKSVKRIECTAFCDCKNIASIKVDEGNEYYDSRENCNAIIQKNGDILVCGCPNTKIPNGIKAIGDYAFYGIEKITSITIPNTVESIGNYAFNYATGLTSVTIPSSVKTIGNHAFDICSNLKDVTIPEGVNSVGDYAFSECKALKSLSFPNSVITIGQGALSYCSNLETVKLPDNLKTIERKMFRQCYGLESISIPNSVTTIGDAAFMECKYLKTINLPENLVVIGDSAFYEVGREKYYEVGTMTIDFPATLKSIGAEAFYLCNVSHIIIPGNVEKIGRYAFRDISFVNLAEKPQDLIGHDPYYEDFPYMDMHVYEGLKDVYQNSVWGGLVKIIDDIPRNSIIPVIADGSEVGYNNLAKLTSFRLLANGNVGLNNNMKAKIYAEDKLIGKADINDVTLANGIMTINFKGIGNQGDTDSFGTVKTKIVIEAGSINMNNEANPIAFSYTYNASKAIFGALPTGINTISTTTLSPQISKRIANGRIVIEKGGKLYGIDGKIL